MWRKLVEERKYSMATGTVLVLDIIVTSLGHYCTNTAPTADRILTVDDAVDILEELLPVQSQSFLLGLKLKLPLHEVEVIHQQYAKPRDCLFHTIIAFLRRTEPKPTWRVIVDALKNATLGLPALARKLEAAHFPDAVATRGFSGKSF